MSYPAIVFDWCSQQVTKHWGWWPARLCKTWCICLTNTLVVLVLKGGGNWYGAVSAPLIKAQWANDPHHEGQHHSLLITLCSLFTNFYHSIVVLCNFFFFGEQSKLSVIFPLTDAYWFSSREAEYCTPSLNLTLGLPSHLSCGRLCVLQTFLHCQCRFQKQWSKMRTTHVPPPLPSTPLQMSHSNTWPELLIMSLFKLTSAFGNAWKE